MASGLRRTIDAFRRVNYSVEDDGRNESLVMGYIHGYYKEALDRLPASMDSLVHEAGVCFGFLDPVSNIIVNAAASYDSPAEETKQGQRVRRRGKRKRSQAPTSIKAKGKRSGSKSGDATLHGSEVTNAETSYIEAQSLEGLVTFLTTCFRYLTRSEALRYLRLAKADLLVAVCLIEEDRDSEAFTVHGPTTKVALTCAALSAFHPQVTGSNDPKVIRFVYGCLTLASCLDEVSLLLAAPGRLCTSTLSRLSNILTPSMHQEVESGELVRRAIARFPHSIQKRPFPFDLELALMKVLLDKIHGFYLKAISCIPALSLRMCHHRGLLKAGHCYGQFDPVTNIILNTIWYDIAFPPEQTFEVDMINDESLSRVECQSLHGLVTFITTLFPAISTYDATRYLLLDNARLDHVILRANQNGYQTFIPQHDAYKAAACAAHHPNPIAIANFAMGFLLEEGVKLQSLIEAKRTLSPDDIQSILSLVQAYPRSKPVVVQKLTSRASKIVSAKRKDFEDNQSLIRGNVQAALRKHAQDEGEEYELLAICGVNAQIPKNGKFGYYENYNGYPYSHINIWAMLKGPHLVDVSPTLLFIQCANDFEDMEDTQSLCLPVLESSKDAGRCFHCENSGTKIVHPTSQAYLGQCFDFEEMARKEHSLTNEELVGSPELRTVFVDTSEGDCIYFDPAWDADFAVRLNRDAKREDEGEDGASARAQISKVREVLREMVGSEQETVSSIC